MSKFIIAISGTHGTGKSTVLEGLRENGASVFSTQLSRTAQKILGWDSLSVAEESVANMWALQYKIIELMQKRDAQIIMSKKVTVVERSPADVWAYTKMWMRKFNIDEFSQQPQHFKSALKDLMINYVNTCLLFPNENIPFEVQKQRADFETRGQVQQDLIEFLTDTSSRCINIPMYDKNQRISLCLANYVTQHANHSPNHLRKKTA